MTLTVTDATVENRAGQDRACNPGAPPQPTHFYDISKDLSSDALIYILLGGRGIGKSYSAKKYVIQNFIARGEQFVYLRRYKDELQKTAKSYFNDIVLNSEFPSHEIEITSDYKYKVDGKIAGHCMNLSTAQKYKSSSYPEVTTIIFEEFLSDGRYLPHEPFKFLELLETIIRLRDNAKVIMIGNAMTNSNPYFLAWNLTGIGNKPTLKNEIYSRILETDENFKVEKLSTKLGKLSQKLGYTEYSLENNYAKDNKNPIIKLTHKASYFCTIKTNNNNFGTYAQGENIIIKLGGDSTCPAQIIINETIGKPAENGFLRRTIYRAAVDKKLAYTDKKSESYFAQYLKYFV